MELALFVEETSLSLSNEDDDEQSRDDKAPAVLLLSSGETTPFELTLAMDRGERQRTLGTDGYGAVEWLETKDDALMRRSRGFTLLEIMIAVAVFAVASAALIKNSALTVRQTGLIRDKTVAFWIAENQLAQYRAGPREPDSFPRTGSDRFPVTMSDKDWEVVADVQSTGNDGVRRIEVSVYRDENLDAAVATLTGFIGRW
ncbi:MAG: type II secretion system minor pseudopilin GspI [Gammaproteobacteria bacterium]|nr:type II secretion system minor pseudopilin GspI [Gammaproteobacteria bacterium]